MEDIKERVVQLFEEKGKEAFIHLKHCNFEQAVITYLEAHGLVIPKEELVEGEKESYIDSNGVFKYKKTIKFKTQQLKLLISCSFEKEWNFYFEQIMPIHIPIQEKRINYLEDKKFVLVSFVDEEMKTNYFSIPLHLAEELDLEEFHDKDMELKEKQNIWNRVEQFRVLSMIQLK